jgi:hypothetical protein
VGSQEIPKALFCFGLVLSQRFGVFALVQGPLPRPLSRLRERGGSAQTS